MKSSKLTLTWEERDALEQVLHALSEDAEQTTINGIPVFQTTEIFIEASNMDAIRSILAKLKGKP